MMCMGVSLYPLHVASTAIAHAHIVYISIQAFFLYFFYNPVSLLIQKKSFIYLYTYSWSVALVCIIIQ